ncbi:DICT sensory domain-containing protein [Amycolatopsis sp. NPDC004079]|uniref:DICT sensory domain-containing protein n=1 Tax=Amycolatopsis sp. NPDC004079 TaxID=3154549 RepID=UPI0033ADB355
MSGSEAHGVPSRAGLLSKRTLVIASHAVEQAALAEQVGEQVVVFALFQRLPYFEREREVYAKIAGRAAVTVVGMVDSGRPDLPHGVIPVLLHPEESLAREWSVAVLSPTFGASVIAEDLDEIDPHAQSIEGARRFRGRWGWRRDEAYAEIVRLRDAFGDRLPPTARRKVADLLDQVVEPANSAVESRTEATVRHLCARLEKRRPAAREPAVDPSTGLASLSALDGWLGEATDTVSFGLLLLAVDDLTWVERRYGSRVRMHTEQNIADLIREDLRPLDRAVRLSENEFLTILPAAAEEDLAARSRLFAQRLGALYTTYPFVDLHPKTTTMLTRSRPLPLGALRAQLSRVTPAPPWPPSTGSLPLPAKPLAGSRMSSAWFT